MTRSLSIPQATSSTAECGPLDDRHARRVDGASRDDGVAGGPLPQDVVGLEESLGVVVERALPRRGLGAVLDEPAEQDDGVVGHVSAERFVRRELERCPKPIGDRFERKEKENDDAGARPRAPFPGECARRDADENERHRPGNGRHQDVEDLRQEVEQAASALERLERDAEEPSPRGVGLHSHELLRHGREVLVVREPDGRRA